MRTLLISLILLSGCQTLTERQALLKECEKFCAKANKGQCLYSVSQVPQRGAMVYLAEPKHWCLADEQALELQYKKQMEKYEKASRSL